MKLAIVLLFGVTCALAAEYTRKYDGIDIDKILSNQRILTQYINCLMEEGSCTNEGRELKKTLPDALSTGCSKCNDKQKNASEKVIKHLVKNRPRDWERLVGKYDPSGEYRKKYEAKFKN